MARAPYPGLAPDLWDLVVDMAEDDDPVPEHDRPIHVLRAATTRMEARLGPLPDAVDAHDWSIPCDGRTVRLRRYTGPDPRAETLLYFHGGGWMLGSIEGHDHVCADLALETGMQVVSVDYALAPEHPYPAALDDGLAVIAHLRDTPTADALWLGGDSAGANLALGGALRLRDAGLPMPDGLFLIYPATDPRCDAPSYVRHANAPYLSRNMMRRCWIEYLGNMPPTPYAAPATADLSGLPQAIILTAELDPLVDEGDALARALSTHGDVWHEQATGLIHGFLRFRDVSAASDAAFLRAVRALASHLT